MDCTAIKEAISPKTLNKFTFALVIVWIVVGATLCIAFSELEISESRYDIRCDVTGNTQNIDFIRAKCYDRYRIQNDKLGIPPYLFIIVNVLLIPTVTLIYSQYAKSTVTELEQSPQDAQGEPRNRRRTLFVAYLCQLILSIVLEITFIVLLETNLFYPKNFPSDFSCTIAKTSFNLTQSTNVFNCYNQRAGYKNVWIKVVKAANGIFAVFAFLEILWILSRSRHGKKFMENLQFYADHLKSKSNEQPELQPQAMPLHNIEQRQVQEEAIPLVDNIAQEPGNPEHPDPARAQNDFHNAIQTLKKNCLLGTEKLSDLKQPFRRPNHGAGPRYDLTIDKIYVHVVIVEGTASHNFAKDRWEQLKEYPPDADDRLFRKPEDIFDGDHHKNVLVVGRPGIGKTTLSTKLLRLWASGEAFNGDEHHKPDFNVVFLVKFRRFNNDAKLSLRELLAGAETIQRLDDSVWEFVQNESTKVLLIFDGLDEYSRKEEINTQEDYKNDVEEKMPVSVLYNKLGAGELLRGASILTTIRPTAVKYVDHVDFQRTLEIRGFTSGDVKEYVENFAGDVSGAKEKMWQHIKSNINLFSFCYIPMNCFLICHCLLQIILSESSQALPTKITDIYKMTVKMLFFNHNREGLSRKELEKLKSTHMYKPFEEFPKELKKVFDSLGEIAFRGIEEGRLLFESSEVSGLEDCGLLHKLPDVQSNQSLNDPPKSQFCFTHLTVQEFFAAKHLANTETIEEIERFVCNHINDGTWQVVLQFVAGLLNSSSDIFIKLLPKPSNGEFPRWLATEDKYLAVQVCKCLYEINDEQQPIFQNKIEKIKFNKVNFCSCSLAPTDVAAVLHFLENAEEVLDIDLSWNRFGDLGANEVKKFIVNRERKLKALDLSANRFTDNIAKDFAAALKHSNCQLEKLSLNENTFTDNAAKDFAAALKHSNCKLKVLVLGSYKFTDNAAKDFVAALQHTNCKLETLRFIYSNFSDDAAKDFAAALKHSNCKLRELGINHNNFTDNAAKDFAAALKHSNCKLKELKLGSRTFTDNAAKDFVAALKHSNCKLTRFGLLHNNFTDKAAKDFAAALKHSNCKLKLLFFTQNNFTEEGRQYLTDAGKQSNCRVDLFIG